MIAARNFRRSFALNWPNQRQKRTLPNVNLEEPRGENLFHL